MRLGDHTDWLAARRGAFEQDVISRDVEVSARQANSAPALLAVKQASGIFIEDYDGRRYIDFYGNNCHHVGHSHPRVVEAVIRQLKEVGFVSRGQTNLPTVALAELIRKHYPIPAARVMFAPGGSEAVEAALMLSKAHTGRYKTLSFYDSYHGRSAGALSVGGRYRDRTDRLGPLMPGALHVPSYYSWPGYCPDDAARLTLTVMRKVFQHERDIAALIAEPVRTGPTGPFVPPSWFWPEVRALCSEFGTLLLFDEIPGGLGKTGHLFNQSLVSCVPDITIIGKALGGGLFPLSAVILNSELDTCPELNIGYFTHEKNPLAAAAGLATLSVIVENDLPSHVQCQTSFIRETLETFASTSALIGKIDVCGFLFSIGIIDPMTRAASPKIAEALFKSLVEFGLLPMPLTDHTISFSAPLVTTNKQMRDALDILSAAIAQTSEAYLAKTSMNAAD